MEKQTEKRTRKLEKTDKELREQNFTKTRVSKAHIKLFAEYCKEQHISKIDALHEIITFLHKTKMPLIALQMKHDLNFMRKYHDFTAGVLKNFEYSFLSKLDKLHTDNIDFLSKTLNLMVQAKGRDSVILTQNFKLLRTLIQVSVDDEDANSILKETLLAVQASEKEPVKKETKTTKQPGKEIISIMGTVGKNIKVERSAKAKALYLLFNLAEKLVNSQNVIWHNVVIWEGEFTQKLGLTDEESIRNYFAKINTGNMLKLTGYIMDAAYKDKEGQNTTMKTFVVMEIISHVK